MDQFAEEWKPVVGYEGLYEVSNHGRVRRLPGTYGCRNGRILTPKPLPRGYLTVMLSKDNVPSRVYPHHLVAAAFIGPRPKGYDINHIDRCRTNNRTENLEYVTRRENIQHAAQFGAYSGENNAAAKLTKEQVIRIRELKGSATQDQIAKMFGVTQTHVSGIHRGCRWAEKD